MEDPWYAAFKRFITLRDKDIRRIASHTRGEYTVSDVQNEGWLIACDLAGTEDMMVTTLAGPEFQETVLGHLYQRLVRYGDRKVRHAVRLDQKDQDGPDKYDLLDEAGGAELLDPLATLMAQEAKPPQNDDPSPHDTQAGAFVYLLRRNGRNVRSLADYLLISVSHCYRRIARERHLVEHQCSMAFGTAHDDPGFPLRRWRNFRIRRTIPQLNSGFLVAPPRLL